LPVLSEQIIADAVEEAGRVVLEALARGEAPTADALRLLLRGYAATGRDDFRDAIEPALAHALDIAADSPSDESPRWLILFAEAAEASEDERLRETVSALASRVRMNWGGAKPLDVTAASVDAYLRAVPLLDRQSSPSAPLQSAIDELERLVSIAYEPGESVSGELDDQMRVAGALLTAFSLTDRLPYSMLAEELVQHARGALLDAGSLPFALGCDAAAVLARLAVLHQHAEYRAAAVIAPDADYAGDAARILEHLAPQVPRHGLAAAAYGLAVGELQSALP
jgi:hypothetical protein